MNDDSVGGGLAPSSVELMRARLRPRGRVGQHLVPVVERLQTKRGRRWPRGVVSPEAQADGREQKVVPRGVATKRRKQEQLEENIENGHEDCVRVPKLKRTDSRYLNVTEPSNSCDVTQHNSTSEERVDGGCCDVTQGNSSERCDVTRHNSCDVTEHNSSTEEEEVDSSPDTEYPKPSSNSQKTQRKQARQRQLSDMYAREATLAREERLKRRRGLLATPPPRKENGRHVMWKEEGSLVQVFEYSPCSSRGSTLEPEEIPELQSNN